MIPSPSMWLLCLQASVCEEMGVSDPPDTAQVMHVFKHLVGVHWGGWRG